MSQRGVLPSEPKSYGSSLQGSPLHYWGSASRARLLVVGGIHGEEPDTTVLLSRALRVVEDKHSAVVVAAANPDGITRGTRGNARGVDLNRNFPTRDWQTEPITYRWSIRHESEVLLDPGAAPGSEPEVAALIELAKRVQPELILSLHGHLSCIDDPLATPMGRWLAERTGLPLVDDVGYPTPGSMGTWAAEQEIPIVTWELAPESIEAMYHSQLPILVEILDGGWSA